MFVNELVKTDNTSVITMHAQLSTLYTYYLGRAPQLSTLYTYYLGFGLYLSRVIQDF